jgi:dihydrofolate synthase / folylpolyglutamate synthase
MRLSAFQGGVHRQKAPSGRKGSASAYLAERARFGMKLGLRSMHRLLAELGHPERGFPSLLVAGTNGKGSVVAYADAVLGASGLKVGRYTSPHLVRVNERIRVAGRDISGPALEAAVEAVREAAEALIRSGRLGQHPTHFEVLTAAALLEFRRRGVEVALLEVGLGGRGDATNACDPLASAIVTVDLDHQAQLGTTRAEIAREKAGVLRPGRVTVLGRLDPEAREVIAEEARLRGARLIDALDGVRVRERARGLDVVTPRGRYLGLQPLPGRHQRDNLVVALRLLEAAAEAGIAIDPGAVAAGIAATRWPGRLQRLPGRPPVLLDGAHNPAAARALAEHLRGQPPFVLLLGVMADKDVAGVARPLIALAEETVLTRVAGDRAASPEEIARRVGGAAGRAHREPDPGRALALARRLAGPRRPVVLAGSLYLVGDVLQRAGRTRAGRRRPARH